MNAYRKLPFTVAVSCLIGMVVANDLRAQTNRDVEARSPAPDVAFARIVNAFRDPESSHVMVVAHRGGWCHEYEFKAPENSLANIDKAVRLGYDVFETDVARTRDGHLVLMHDDSIGRTTNGRGQVGEISLAELKKLRLRYRDRVELSDETVPTFKEALLRGKNRIMFKIDLKCGLACLPKVLQELKDVGVLEHVMIRVDFNEEAVERVKHALSASPEYDDAIILFICENAEELRRVIDEFHPPVVEIDMGRSVTDEVREMVAVARQAGARVEAHASSDPTDWDAQIDAGIRAFHTMSPRYMIAYLRERGLHW